MGVVDFLKAHKLVFIISLIAILILIAVVVIVILFARKPKETFTTTTSTDASRDLQNKLTAYVSAWNKAVDGYYGKKEGFTVVKKKKTPEETYQKSRLQNGFEYLKMSKV